VRVTAAASQTSVGGRYGSTDPPVLLVRVAALAENGKANAALVEAIARAFEVKRAAVRVVAGLTSRNKVVEVAGADPAVLNELLRPTR
jgi:uncharacterized protein YggU (UPF0235/DUF167 family)